MMRSKGVMSKGLERFVAPTIKTEQNEWCYMCDICLLCSYQQCQDVEANACVRVKVDCSVDYDVM